MARDAIPPEVVPLKTGVRARRNLGSHLSPEIGKDSELWG